MTHMLRYLALVASAAVLALNVSAQAQEVAAAPPNDPDHLRGEITDVANGHMLLRTPDGRSVRVDLADQVTVLSLSEASFTEVDFGVYVGSVSRKLDEFSPIVRDSLSFLHEGFELRIVDESLRGIALGHRVWDLTPESVMSHGWVDDLEVRILSIKYGPTEEEETDVEIGRGVPVLKMALADRSLLKPGAHVFAGAQKASGGDFSAVFIMVGENGVIPRL